MERKNKAKDLGWTLAFYTAGYGLLFFFTYAFITRWRFDFNADMALIGLVAKHILELGDRPIFVWGVGYQGMFLEGYLAALLFHFFGVSPQVLNLTSGIYFVLGTILWHALFAKVYGHKVSSLALLLTTVCCVFYYRIMVRAMPNFAVTYFLGSILLTATYQYARFLPRFWCEKHQKHVQKSTREARADGSPDSQLAHGDPSGLHPFGSRPRCFSYHGLPLIFLIGLISGFGFYTFAIFAVHIFALCSVLALLFLFHVMAPPEDLDVRWTNAAKLIFLPHLWAKIPSGIPTWERNLSLNVMRIIVGVQIVGFIMLFFPEYRFMFQNREIVLRGLEFISHSAFVGLVLHAYFILKYRTHFTIVLRWRSEMISFLTGALIGVSPKLYYHIVQGLRTKKGYNIRGNIEDFSRRWDYMKEFLADLLQLSSNTFLYRLAAMLVLFGFVYFAYKRCRQLFSTLQNPSAIQSPHLATNIIDSFLLSYLILMSLIYIFTNVAYNGYTVRFMIMFVPITMVAVAWSFWQWMDKLSSSKWSLLRAGFIGMIFIGTLFKAHEMNAKVVEPDVLISEKVERALIQHNLTYAYADYWMAYNTTFLSLERVQLQPIYSAYGPYYGPRIAEQHRVGYVVPRGDIHDLVGPGPFTIKNSIDYNRKIVQQLDYRKAETHSIDDTWELHILERL